VRNLFIDTETFYDSRAKYSLKNISVCEFIRDQRFKLHGLAYAFDDQPVHWISGDHTIEAFVNSVDWNDTWLVAHNAKFDGAILAWRYAVKPSIYFDTLALSRAIIGQNLASHSLKSVARFLGLNPKGELKIDGILNLPKQVEKELADYCINDTEICRAIFYKLSGQFPEGQVKSLDWTIRAFVEPKLELDTNTLHEMVDEEKSRRETIFKTIGVEKEAFASNDKFAKMLAGRGVVVPCKESPRVPGKTIPALALGDEGFIALRAVVPDLYEARVAAKSTITETRGAKLEAISKTGSFPFDVQFSGAIGAHRYSGGSGAGGNPQNFPKKGPMRSAVCAPAGSKLVVGDFSAIEARIVAWLAKEEILIRAFLNSEDVYSSFATTVYNRPITKSNKIERTVGKTCILGLGYGMGWVKFQMKIKMDTGINLPENEARRIVSLYRDTYSIPTLWDNASRLLPLMANGDRGILPFAPFMSFSGNTLVLPSGLKIQYPNLRQVDGDKGHKEWVYDVYKKKDSEPVKLYGGKLIENICQALAGEITKIAIERSIEKGLQVVGQVHDEIIVVSDTTKKEVDRQALYEAMAAPIPWWPDLKLAAEIGTGDNWSNAKA